MEDDVRQLLLVAALDDSTRGLEAWRSLLGRTPFEVIDASTTRLLPRVYLTLRRHGSAVPELGRLKGAYRNTWVQSSMLASEALPVLRDLSSAGVRYRLVKGAALGAMGRRWGARSMGDVDIVVSSDAVSVVSNALVRAGFARAFGAVPQADQIDGGWQSGTGGAIDVHVVRPRQRDLLGMVLRAPYRVGSMSGLVVPVPQPELMVLHAVAHGRAAVAATDAVQALADVAELLPRCDPERLRGAASVAGLVPDLAAVLSELEATGVALPNAGRALEPVDAGRPGPGNRGPCARPRPAPVTAARFAPHLGVALARTGGGAPGPRCWCALCRMAGDRPAAPRRGVRQPAGRGIPRHAWLRAACRGGCPAGRAMCSQWIW